MDHDLTAESKAYLVSVGSVARRRIASCGRPEDVCNGGAGGGGKSVFLTSGGRRVRLSINPASPLRVVPRNGDVEVMRGDTIIA